MKDAKSDKTIDALEHIDVKTLSYIQLRRLHAVLMDATGKVNGEIQRRKEDDNAGDTVRIPAPPAE